MPKEQRERIIDQPYRQGTRVVTTGSGGGGGGGGGSSTLAGLTDVQIATPQAAQVLTYSAALGKWVNAASQEGMAPHDLSGSYHTGLLNWSLINFTGSNLTSIATRLHSSLQGIGPNDHHNQVHVLATNASLGPDHTISGAAAGYVLRASSATAANFQQLLHTDLANVLPDQHHAQVHNIVGTDHTITGAQWSVVGATALNTLGLMVATNAPGAAAALLRTDANGGIQLDTNLLYVDGANNRVGINITPGNAALDMRASNLADHTQRIRQLSGQTGRMWRIEDTGGNELIILDSVGNLQSGRPGFVSGLTGWQITPQGNAEFNNIWARGELHATVFVKDEVHATGGSFFVATAGVLHDDANISSSVVDDDVLYIVSTPAGYGVPLQVVTTSGTFVGNELHVSWIGNFININDPSSGPGFYFQPGDVVRSKTEIDTGVTDYWLEVNSATQNTGYSTYSVTKRSGTDGTLPKGSAVVSYGKQGDGRILMTSDLNYAPYIDVFTTGYQVWTGSAGAIIPRVRMGRLDGIGLPGISGVEQYGMIAGKDLTDANSGYLIASNTQFSLYKVDIRLNNGTNDTGLWTANGNIRIGKNIGADATTGFRVVTAAGDPEEGNVIIGDITKNHYLRWDSVAGILTIRGNLIVQDPGSTVTLQQVTDMDNVVRSDAQGYANTAQTNAQTYGDARRITGVTGSWTSSSANVVSWGSPTAVTATFVNGGSRSIAAGNTGTMSARTYLYVNTALAGTLTMIPLTAPDTTHPTYALIAVCDPGTPRASVTVVAGTTFISGANIATGSIQAANIAALTITGDQILGNSIDGGKITIGTISGDRADSGFLVAVGGNKIVGIGAGISSVDFDTVQWAAGTQISLASGVTITLALGSFTFAAGDPAGTRAYLWIYSNASTTGVTMTGTTTLSSVPVSPVPGLVVAVAQKGVSTAGNQCSITLTAGGTIISGDNILTGTITATAIKAGSLTATEIAADSITANKMHVNNLAAMTGTLGAMNTGILTVDAAGNIHSSGKTFGGGSAGFFMGNNAGAYVFDVGNNANYLRWDGADLKIATAFPIDITAQGSNNTILTYSDQLGHSGYAAFNWDASGAGMFTSDAFRAFSFVRTPFVDFYNPSSTYPITFMIVTGPGGISRQMSFASNGSITYNGDFTALGIFGSTVNSTGNAIRIQTERTTGTRPPNAGSSMGSVGDICYDTQYIYVKTSTGWGRVTLDKSF